MGETLEGFEFIVVLLPPFVFVIVTLVRGGDNDPPIPGGAGTLAVVVAVSVVPAHRRSRFSRNCSSRSLPDKIMFDGIECVDSFFTSKLRRPHIKFRSRRGLSSTMLNVLADVVRCNSSMNRWMGEEMYLGGVDSGAGDAGVDVIDISSVDIGGAVSTVDSTCSFSPTFDDDDDVVSV